MIKKRIWLVEYIPKNIPIYDSDEYYLENEGVIHTSETEIITQYKSTIDDVSKIVDSTAEEIINIIDCGIFYR